MERSVGGSRELWDAKVSELSSPLSFTRRLKSHASSLTVPLCVSNLVLKLGAIHLFQCRISEQKAGFFFCYLVIWVRSTWYDIKLKEKSLEKYQKYWKLGYVWCSSHVSALSPPGMLSSTQQHGWVNWYTHTYTHTIYIIFTIYTHILFMHRQYIYTHYNTHTHYIYTHAIHIYTYYIYIHSIFICVHIYTCYI